MDLSLLWLPICQSSIRNAKSSQVKEPVFASFFSGKLKNETALNVGFKLCYYITILIPFNNSILICPKSFFFVCRYWNIHKPAKSCWKICTKAKMVMKFRCKYHFFQPLWLAKRVIPISHTQQMNNTQNTVTSPNFLVLKFCGKAQFLHIFGRIVRTYVKTMPFHKNSTK